MGRFVYDHERGLILPGRAEPRSSRILSAASQQALMGYGGAAPATDPDFANVTFLCHCEGAPTGTTFTEVTGKTITQSNASTETAAAKYGSTGASLAGSSYLFTDHHSSLDLTTGDFTIEFWANTATTSGVRTWIAKQTGTGVYPFQLAQNVTTDKLTWRGFNTSVGLFMTITGTTTLVTGTWYHVAMTRNGTTFTLWLNGASEGTATSSDALYTNASDGLFFGNNGAGSSGLSGYMDDIRITKGVCRYTAPFTPPAAQFPDA